MLPYLDFTYLHQMKSSVLRYRKCTNFKSKIFFFSKKISNVSGQIKVSYFKFWGRSYGYFVVDHPASTTIFFPFSPKRYKNYLPCSVIQENLLCWSSIFNASNINSVKTQCFDYWTWTLVTIVFLFLAFTKALREKNDCGQSLWAVFAFWTVCALKL